MQAPTRKISPAIGITWGDAAGIGPEVIRQALQRLGPERRGVKIELIGTVEGCTPGKLTLRSARLTLDALHQSVDLLRAGDIQAVVNGPVSKENLTRAGFKFPGQTEFYAHAFGLGPDDVTMTMQSSRLRVALVSTHCSLRQAVSRLTTEKIVLHASRMHDLLLRLDVKKPRLALCGLNPHAGEHGLFGNEEARIILPAVQRLQKKFGPRISGPFCPDAVFGQALAGKFDGVVCLYHDQGLIPFKLVSFDDGVNLTAGLPFWRCSPDHGTAVDLAGRNRASACSMTEAIRLALRLVQRGS